MCLLLIRDTTEAGKHLSFQLRPQKTKQKLPIKDINRPHKCLAFWERNVEIEKVKVDLFMWNHGEGATGEEKDNKILFTLNFQFQMIGCFVC